MHVLQDPERWMADSSKLLKRSRAASLVRVPAVTNGQPSLILRRLNYGRLLYGIRDFFRASRAQRAFFRGLTLERVGVDTASPYAFAEVRRWRWPVRAYLLTEEIVGQDLESFLREQHTGRREVIARLATLLAQMHARGFSDRDLKPSNVMIDRSLQPHLIDLDGVRRRRLISTKRICKDLAKLVERASKSTSVPRSDYLRFLKRYCGCRGITDWRMIWRRVAVVAQRQ